MPGSTSRFGFAYPLGTDAGGTGDVTIKNLAEALDTKLDIHTMPDGIGRRARNLATYSESVSNGTGWIVIQTNIPTNSSVMTMLRLTGLFYESDNGLVDVAFTFYPYSADSSILVPEVTNMGSAYFGTVQFLNKTSNNTVAIALSPGQPQTTWQYPKLAVDGIFGHSALTDAQLKTGWSIYRTDSLAAFTVKTTALSPRGSAEDTGWITPTLINNWTQYSLADWPAQYRRKGGITYIRGLVAHPGGATPGSTGPIFNLPVGFRPIKQTLRGQIDAGGTMRQVYVENNGNIYPSSTPHPAWMSIENIQFPAEG